MIRRLAAEILQEGRAAALDHVEIDPGDRIKAAAVEQDRLAVKHVGSLPDFAVGAEQGGVGQAAAHEFQGHQPVLEDGRGESRAAEVDHVDLDPPARQFVHQAVQEHREMIAQVVGGVEEVDPENAQRLGLPVVGLVEQAHVQLNVAAGTARLGLETQPHPAVALLLGVVEAAGAHRVRQGEEGGAVAALGVQAVLHDLKLVVEHRDHALARHVARALAVNLVAEGHVVGRHGLGHRAGSAAGAEEPVGDLLSRPDLGEGAVHPVRQVELQRFFQGPETVVGRLHGIHASTGSTRRDGGLAGNFSSAQDHLCD